MPSPTISGASGYTAQADYVERPVKAGEDITKGDVLCWDATDDDGITVAIAGATSIPCGVALTDADDGAYFRMQTRGLNKVALTTDGGVAAGHVLYADASGAVDSSAIGSITDGDFALLKVGVALADDASTSQAIGTCVLFPTAGW